jgi:uncharacterized membrane protein YfcA
MDQHLAQGTALVMILPNVLVGFVRYRQRNHIDLRATAWLAALTMLSTYIAARYAALIDPFRLRVGFALLLIVLSDYFNGAARPAHAVLPGAVRHRPGHPATTLIGLAGRRSQKAYLTLRLNAFAFRPTLPRFPYCS